MNFITLLDYVGTFAFAISGIRLASAKHFDWFGAYVVGFVTAVGGGTLRDLLLGLPPFWMQNVSYLVVSGFAFLFVVGLRKYVIRLNNTFFIFDAVGLGLFTVVGIQKSIAVGYPMWVGIIMGTLTGAAGGMLRDVLLNEVPLIFRKDIYAIACICGGLIYYLCMYLDTGYLAGANYLAGDGRRAAVVVIRRCFGDHHGQVGLSRDGRGV